ncbi:MAG TPA: GreA/GreB family elongation factor [Chthoniobacterales bacterium]|nr:GreA/GreB family elongation factor [Chthoniobacterales bacterium]
MDSDLQALVDSGKIAAKTGQQLQQLTPGTYCQHKSWGFGQVKAWNLLLNQVVVDFASKKHHTMQPQYAAESLQPLPNDHFLVRKATRLDVLKTQAETDLPDFFVQLLNGFGGKLTQDQIQKTVTPEVVSEADFKKWWDNAKKSLRKDGRFALPTKKTEPISVREQALSYSDELIGAFQKARQLKDQVNRLDQIVKNAGVFGDKTDVLQAALTQAEESVSRNRRLHPAQAMELLIERDDLVKEVPSLSAAAITLAELLQEHESKLGQILALVAAARQRRVLCEFLTAFPQDWARRLLHIFQSASYRIVAEIAKVFVENKRAEDVRQFLLRAIADHSASSDILYWLAKDRATAEFSDLIVPDVLAAMLGALERDQFAEGRRGSKLHDLLIDDKDLIYDLIISASVSQARDLMRRLMMTPVFEELNKRSLMARMIKVHGDLQQMVSGESEGKEEALIVSWPSLEKRKAEYDDLVSKKIPENTKEIGIARSYGDLRENFEYKAAKEMQTVLMRRKAELEQMLSRARGTAFENIEASQVSIGTSVVTRDLDSGELSTFHVLGAWDSDPAKGILSYQTAIGQALLGKTAGDSVELPGETSVKKVEIVEITAWQDTENEALAVNE